METAIKNPVTACAVEGDRALIFLSGDLDLATKDGFLSAVRSVLDAGATSAAVDISEVDFVDSTGLGALLEAHYMGLHLSLLHPTDRVRRVLDLVLLGNIISMVD